MKFGITVAVGVGLLLANTKQMQHDKVPVSIKPKTSQILNQNLKQDLNCLTANIYFEARGESLQGKQAVAAVTLNRVKSKKYPKTICAVVEQRRQFSWVNNLNRKAMQSIKESGFKPKKPLDLIAYQESEQVARTMLKVGAKHILPEQVLWYHADFVKPVWATKMQKVKVIDKHVFYKT